MSTTTDPSPYAAAYTVATFAGAPNVVTNAVATGVTVTPVAPTPLVSPYVVKDTSAGAPPGAVVISGAVSVAITISDGSRNVFYPVGLAVQPTATRVRPAATLFPMSSVSGPTITLTDNDVPGTPTSYEFVVLFQDSNGNFGALDPKIGNM
jgi:hypothetical protein